LIESIAYPEAKPLLNTLPRVAAVKNEKEETRWALNAKESEVLVVAGALPARIGSEERRSVSARMEFAHATPESAGLVLDYIAVYNYSSGSYTFQSNTTYYISSTVSFNDKVVMEGGAILKFPPYNPSSPVQININGASAVVSTLTSPYRPAIITGRDDNTVGEAISGSTGTPSGHYANYVLNFDTFASATPRTLSQLHVRYAYRGLGFNGGSHIVKHSQFLGCYVPFEPQACELKLRNVLVSGAYQVFGVAQSSTLRCENVTADSAFDFGSASGIYLTNCILTAIGNPTYTAGAPNYVGVSSSGIYQIVGASTHYLASSSPHRNVGTVNIDPGLLADLRERTTYPPTERTTDFISTEGSCTDRAKRHRRD
jgi:hypothetical protein